jgi:hypothetical protein
MNFVCFVSLFILYVTIIKLAPYMEYAIMGSGLIRA